MIAREIPDDADWPQMVGLAKMDNFLRNLRACLVGRVFGDRFLVRQAKFALFLKGRLPSNGMDGSPFRPQAESLQLEGELL